LRVRERERAEEALHRARSGEDFAALVHALSEDPSAPGGGDLGQVRISELAEPLRTAAGALAPGETSPILETPAGYVLLRREN
jgi:parvulin-like peptidyl-prolyl isomerase